MAEKLELTLLGNPELRLAGQPLARFRSAKVYALLYYLAVTRRVQPRTVLAGLFWGDIDEYYARRNFSRTLSDLAQFVGDHLVIERQSVAFARSQPYWLDVEVLETASATAPTAQNIATLAATANLYRGDFLDGFYVQDAPEFEQWVLTERTRLRASALQLLDTLSRYSAEQGALTQAMDYTRRILQLEPWSEEAHRQLMLFLAQSGQRSAALAQFELCRQALLSELNVEPDVPTLELVARIRAGGVDKVTHNKVTHDKVTHDKVTNNTVTSDKTTADPRITQAPSYSVTQPPMHNLPSPLTTFVGRRTEIEAVKELLKQHRLLTLTGPGGIGKTRLALQVAEEMRGIFADGVCFVDLSAITENSLLTNTIAHLLGVAESLETPLFTLIQAALCDKQFLLLLDNFEHLLDAAPLVADLLATCRRLTVLITSREPLALYGEQEYGVPTLQLPELPWSAADLQPPDHLLTNEALQLFVRCAQAVAPSFRLTAENATAVATICLRLDGLPLAIELAAAYVKVLAPQTLLTQLDSHWLEMKRALRNVPTRQQTLRNTIEWSYRFLNEQERRLFAQLAVFRGGCTWEAIVAVCDDAAARPAAVALLEALNGLVNKSLVWRRSDHSGQPRFGMLETIREYALLCLQEQGAVETLQQRHALYYTEYTNRVEAELMSIKQRQVLNQLECEVDNFRAALRWALDHDPEPGLRMIGDLGTCWRIRGYLTEGMGWAQQLLAARQQTPIVVQAKAYASTAILALVLGHRRQAYQLAEEAYQISQQLADRQTRAQVLHAMATTRLAPNLTAAEYAEIITLIEEATQLYTEVENRLGLGRILNLMGEVKRMQQRYAEAKHYYEESLQVLRVVGYASGVTTALTNLGWVAFHLGNYQPALATFVESMDLSYELDYPHNIAMSLMGAAGALTRLQHPETAVKLLAAAHAIRQSIGIVMDLSDEPDYEQTYAALQVALGQTDFDRCWQAGSTLTVAAATALMHKFA